MPAPEWRLWIGLLVGMAAVQALLWLLARGLRLRLGRAAVLGGLLLPLLLLAPWLDGRPLLVPCNVLSAAFPGVPKLLRPDPYDLLNDAVLQFLPWELEVRHALSARRLPFWSDLLEGGSSPWANPQAAVLSPLSWPARLLPIQHHLLALLAFKMLVAFEGTWLLARRLGRSRPSSLLAAGGFALGGALLPWALFPHSTAAAWVPWLATGTVGLFRRPDGRGIATTAAIAAVLLLSGHPETAAIGGLFAGLCGLCFRRRKAGLARAFCAAALAAALGFGLAAPHLLPFLHLLPGSQRAAETLALRSPAHAVERGDPRTWFELGRFYFMLSPTNPHAFGRPYRDPFVGPVNWADGESGYAGLVAFAGTWIALLAVRDRRVWPLAGFALLALLLPARFVPLSRLLHLVPALRLPAYARFLLVGCLALALAGAFGTDRLLGLGRGTSGRRPGLAAGMGLAVAAALSLWVAADRHAITLWILLAAAALTARLRGPRALPGRHDRGRRLTATAAGLLGLALLLDLVPWGRSLLPKGHAALFYPHTPFLADLEREVAAPGGPYRAIGADLLVYPSLLSVYGLADPRPHNPLAPGDYLEVLDSAFGFHPTMDNYFARLGNLDHPLLDFLGVRGVVSSVAMPPSRTLVPADGGRYAPFFLLRNPDALPRWFLPAGAEAVGRSAVPGWIARLADPGRVALLKEEVGNWRPGGLDGRVRPVRPVAEAPGRVSLELPPGTAETLVVSSLPFSDGWAAQAAGRRLPTVHVDGAFLGVRVPAGAARLDLRFLPPGLVPGLAACLAALLACAALLVRRGRARGSAIFRTQGARGRGSLPRGRGPEGAWDQAGLERTGAPPCCELPWRLSP